MAKVTGVDETGRRLRALPAELGSKGGGPLRSALFQAAKVLQKEAVLILKSKTRTDSNLDGVKLSENIITKRHRNPKSVGAIERYDIGMRGGTRKLSSNRRGGRAGKTVRTEGQVWYGRMIELGTSKMKARPFLRPALSGKKDEALRVFSAKFLKAVEAAERKLGRSS
ncbi:MAG: HK97-gp10 family putative phage morphogenesis protein [Luteimonas sp.]